MSCARSSPPANQIAIIRHVLASGTSLALLLTFVTTADADTNVDFDRDVRPILDARCLKCHGNDEAESGLRLTSLKDATAELESGVRAVVPGQAHNSELVRRVTADASERMPPEGPPLTAAEIQVLRRWIDAGANWPGHWAYRPLVRPEVPRSASVRRLRWVRTPIDSFVLAALNDGGMSPSPEADRRTLLRRVYFDLIGMPPTPDELDAFLADSDDRAYDRAVDRLLSSPHYGERWARHWMDVVHYAETHGHDQDRPREHAWPYRDYLIQSFNGDKSYSRFVQEQVAGDVLFAGDAQALIATGFLATGPWDESSLRDIRDDTLDRQIARNLDRDDILTTVMSTFSSSTVHCARCHDHKFDPISQHDYYALQSVFAGIDKANRVYDPDSRVSSRRSELTSSLAELPDRLARKDATLLSARLQDDVARWEAGLKASSVLWHAIEITAITARNGSELRQLDDGSILAGGARPDKETYSVEFNCRTQPVTGLRLEVLVDDSLPHTGPGRCDNGNLHLNEIVVSLVDNDGSEDATTVELRRASADFNQEGWSIDKALDGNAGTAWGIYPAVGQPHQAVFTLAKPLVSDAPPRVRVELRQTHGGGHLIGRFRLSTTDATGQLDADLRAADLSIADILRTAASERTDEQRMRLAAAYLEETLGQELQSLPARQMVYCGTSRFEPDGSFKPAEGPRPIHLLGRGEMTNPGPLVAPAALSCLPGLSSTLEIASLDNEGSRRAALARWLTDSNNVLTWRSIANRVWHYHFGRGLVDTPNDFGRMGGTVSHPALLDWLACELRDNDGSLKKLHRLIVTSAVYRQRSDNVPSHSSRDAENKLLWRMNRMRLDAESIRDAVLRISGELDTRMGGPSNRQFVQTPGIHVTPNVDYVNFDVNDPALRRRSVYRFVFRTLPDPFMDALDCPDASQLTPKRNASQTPLQALALLNDKLIVRHSQHIARRIELETNADQDAEACQVEAAFRLILLRSPSSDEAIAVREYTHQHGLENACRMLLNTNEFIFVD